MKITISILFTLLTINVFSQQGAIKNSVNSSSKYTKNVYGTTVTEYKARLSKKKEISVSEVEGWLKRNGYVCTDIDYEEYNKFGSYWEAVYGFKYMTNSDYNKMKAAKQREKDRIANIAKKKKEIDGKFRWSGLNYLNPDLDIGQLYRSYYDKELKEYIDDKSWGFVEGRILKPTYYLEKIPNGKHSNAAKKRITGSCSSVPDCAEAAKNYPELYDLAEKRAYKFALNGTDVSMRTFISRFPDSKYNSEIKNKLSEETVKRAYMAPATPYNETRTVIHDGFGGINSYYAFHTEYADGTRAACYGEGMATKYFIKIKDNKKIEYSTKPIAVYAAYLYETEKVIFDEDEWTKNHSFSINKVEKYSDNTINFNVQKDGSFLNKGYVEWTYDDGKYYVITVHNLFHDHIFYYYYPNSSEIKVSTSATSLKKGDFKKQCNSLDEAINAAISHCLYELNNN